MRHYEIVAVIHPDQHSRAGEMAERYKKIIAEGGGVVHRFEDWGLRELAYPLKKQKRAQYILFNIECGAQTLGALEEDFRFSEAVMRTLVVRRERAVSGDSPVIKKIAEEKEAARMKAEESAREAAKAEAAPAAKEGTDKESPSAKPAKSAKPGGEKGTVAKPAVKGKEDKDDKDAKEAKEAKEGKKRGRAAKEADEGDKTLKAPRAKSRVRRPRAADEGDDDGDDGGDE